MVPSPVHKRPERRGERHHDRQETHVDVGVDDRRDHVEAEEHEGQQRRPLVQVDLGECRPPPGPGTRAPPAGRGRWSP